MQEATEQIMIDKDYKIGAIGGYLVMAGIEDDFEPPPAVASYDRYAYGGNTVNEPGHGKLELAKNSLTKKKIKEK